MKGKTNSQIGGLRGEKLNISLKTNQSNHNDLIGATIRIIYAENTIEYIWNGSEFTVEVPPDVEYSVEYGAVEGYATPAKFMTTAVKDNARSISAEYKTEMVSVTLNADNGASVNGAKVTINGKLHTWNGTTITQEVAFGTTYSVSVGSLDGFSTPSAQNNISANQASRSLTFTYIASAVKVNILSNQETDAVIAAVKATVKYGSTTLEVSNGQQVNIPTDQEVTISFPNVEGYKTPDTIKFTNTNGGVVEKTGTYQTQLLTVNVTYSGVAPSGYTITGKDSGGNVLFTQAVAFATHKIPYGTSYTVSASKLDGYDAVADQSGVANSTSNTITMMYVHNPVKDLSLYDIYGNSIARSTANCYVVRESGQYKFPCVFGNAIKNGKVNTAAFTNNGGSYSHDFVTGSDVIISSPYIEDPSSPTIVSADCENVISNLQIVEGDECRFIQFSVNQVPTTGGNVIIKLAPGLYGVSAWSWHIWLWPHDLSPVEITNSTGVKYNIMPVNLASKYDSDGVHIKNWFYQWGRKDPMLLPSAWNSTTDHTPGSIIKKSKASDLFKGIQNPTEFYYNSSSPFNWFGSKSYYNLWDAACTGTGNSDNDTVKTVYDPCPVGWKVPNGNTFTGLTILSLSSANGIVQMERYLGDTVGVGFPISGFRYGSDGSLYDVGSDGCVWLSSAYSQNTAYYLYFNSSSVNPRNLDRRAGGFSVRPVEDDNIQLDVIMISFTISGTTHQAESGMTWFEWVNSEYNIHKSFLNYNEQLYFIGSSETPEDSYSMFVKYKESRVNISSNIIGGAAYSMGH